MKHKLLVYCLCATTLFAGEPLQLRLENLTFTSPANWVDVPVTSPMRKATWRTSTEGDAAEIAFFAFGKDQGGTVNENIQRWYGQFSESATKGESATVEIAGNKVTFARSEGIFSSGMPGGPTTPLPDYALCGAIIETKSGMVFLKMTGLKSVVTKMEAAFTEMVQTASKN